MKGNERISWSSRQFQSHGGTFDWIPGQHFGRYSCSQKFLEAIVNSIINEPIIGLNTEREILFINNEALNVLTWKENVIRKSAEELSLKNDLLLPFDSWTGNSRK